MKKRFIILLIIIISLSLVGLVSIQLYWIKNAISVKEVNFDRGVSEAVSSAVYKYNKIEVANKLFHQRFQDQQFDKFYNLLDSLNRLYYQKVFAPENNTGDPSASEDYTMKTTISFDLSNPGEEKTKISFDTSYVNANPGSVKRQGYIQRNNHNNLESTAFEMFRERTKFINDLFEDLFYNQFSFNISYDSRQPIIDSLLNSELQNYGINTGYEFGIYNPVFNSLVAEKTGKYSQKLLEEGYVFSLFPNIAFNNPEYLVIYFPDQKKYVMSQLNLLLGTSSVLIFAIIFSFVFIIFTIIRQKKLSVMKNDFINNMTHELKTPISTISLACQALNDRDVQKTESLYNSYITMIDEENKRLSTMTQKVLQTALIDKGKFKLSISGINIHSIIENAIEKISLQLKNSHGEIITKFNAEYTHIKADKTHLINVIFNLLDNAVKYTTNNPYIVVSTNNNDKGVIISVEDNGIGISKAHQKKIFENLYRVSTGNVHNIKGFGLGLSYVKRVVELHNGYIKLQSELKKGSKFTVYLPFGSSNDDYDDVNNKKS